MASRSYVVNYSGGTPGYVQLKLNIYTVSTDINNNTTTERADLWMQVNNSSAQWYNNYPHNSYVGINGHDYTRTNTTFDARTTGDKLLIGTWDTVVTHDNNGTKTIGVSAWHNSGVGLGNASTGALTYTCDTIPRQATIVSATDFNDEGNPSFTFTNPAGFTIDAYLEFGSPTTTILRTNIPNTGSYTFSLTSGERTTLLGKCPNSNTMTVRYVLQTNVGGTPTWWSWVDKTMSVVNANPTFTTYTYKDTNTTTTALTGNNQILVKGYSNLQADITTANKAVALKSATMVKYRMTNGNDILDEENYSGSSTVSLNSNGVTIPLIRVYAIDSRNNSTYKDYTPTMKDYQDITITSSVANRSTGGIGTTTELAYSGYIWNDSFGSITNSVKSATYKYKKTTDTSYTTGSTTITPTLSSNSYSFTGNINGDLGASGFSREYNFDIQITITDELSSYTFNYILSRGIPQLAFGKNGGVSVGEMYDDTNGGVFQINGIDIFKAIYPIGSIYMSISSTNPSSFFGGTWVAWGAGRVPVGIDAGQTEFDVAEETGGSKTHTLTTDEMPTHSHSITNGTTDVFGFARMSTYATDYLASSGTTRIKESYDTIANTGGGQAHTNLQPYIVCYMWKRTA